MNERVSKQPDFGRLLVTAPLFLALAWALGAVVASNDVYIVRAAFFLSAVVLASLLLFWMVSRSDPEGGTLFTVLMLSLAFKLLAMAFRFQVGLLADAWSYNYYGEDIAATLASGRWPEEIQYGGTEFIELLTGLVYFVTGNTIYGISILWAWFGLVGMLFFYKAFTTAFPGGNRRLYMYLIFLYPSMLLWTSSLGKDALMVMVLGMASYGFARLQQRIDVIGLWWLGAGVVGALMIRPHIAAAVAVAAGLASLIRPIRAGMMTPVIRFAGVLIFAAVAVVVIQAATGYVELDGLGAENVLGFIETQQTQSERGGSAFGQVSLRSNPLLFLVNIPTVLFRPFPWEAGGAIRSTFAMIASLEGMGLLALFVLRWRSVRAALGASTRVSYILFTVAYALMFIFMFSAIANFGILARQRASLFPFAFMWIAYLGPERWRRGADLTAQAERR